MAKSFKTRLKGMQENWETAKEGIPTIPEGRYLLQLQEAEIVESTSGRLMIRRKHLVIDGEYQGETVTDNLQLETGEMSLFFTRQWIEKMGYECPEDISQLPAVVEEISEAHPVVSATAKKSGDFLNIRVEELVETEDVETTPDSDGSEENEDAESQGFSVGNNVSFMSDDGVLQGTVVDFDSESGEVHVEDEDGELWALDPEEINTGESETEDDDDGGEDGGDDEDEERSALIDFCGAADIEVNDDATIEEIVSELNEYDWPAEELTDDEKEMLKRHGVSIVEPKPAPKKAEAKSKAKAKGKVKGASTGQILAEEPSPTSKAKAKTTSKGKRGPGRPRKK